LSIDALDSLSLQSELDRIGRVTNPLPEKL